MTIHELTLALLLAEAVAVAAFAVIAYRLYRASRLLASERLLYHTTGFMLLAVSQALMTLAIVTGDPRLQVAFYAASSITAIGGLYAVSPSRGQGGNLQITPVSAIGIAEVKAILVVADGLAGLLGLDAARRTSGPASLLLTGIGASYIIRALSILLPILGAGGLAAQVLLAGETLRALSAAVLSALYATPSRG